jgi:hypothetical protein
MRLYPSCWSEHGRDLGTRPNTALTGPGCSIRRTKETTRGKWRIEHGRLIETWRFSNESSDSTSTEEIIELTEWTFKSRIISQEGPGKPEGQILPSEIFTVTRVAEKN